MNCEYREPQRISDGTASHEYQLATQLRQTQLSFAPRRRMADL
jgi:hypothetical protein